MGIFDRIFGREKSTEERAYARLRAVYDESGFNHFGVPSSSADILYTMGVVLHWPPESTKMEGELVRIPAGTGYEDELMDEFKESLDEKDRKKLPSLERDAGSDGEEPEGTLCVRYKPLIVEAQDLFKQAENVVGKAREVAGQYGLEAVTKGPTGAAGGAFVVYVGLQKPEKK